MKSAMTKFPATIKPLKFLLFLGLLLLATSACGSSPTSSDSAESTPDASDAEESKNTTSKSASANESDEQLATDTLDTEESKNTTSKSASANKSSNDVEGDDSWTVLIYIMGDTDLEEFALYDLVELEEAVGSPNTNILVALDRGDYSDSDYGGLGDFSDTKFLLYGPDGAQLLSEPGELNMGSSGTLQKFISDGLTTFPADHTALVLWDHGGGWTGMGPDESDAYDILTLPEMTEAIANGLSAAGVSRFDLIGMDACLMATYETAHAVNGLTDYFLASEELEPGHGWNYESFASLVNQIDVDPIDLGKTIAKGFQDQANEAGTGGDITLSLLDMSKFEDFDESFVALLDSTYELPSGVRSVAPEMRAASKSVPSYGSNPDPSRSTHHIDLGAFVNRWFDASDTLLSEFQEALDSLVVHKVAGPANERSTGISIYFPAEISYLDLGDEPVEQLSSHPYFQNFESLEWTNFLGDYLVGGTELPEASYPEIDLDSVESDTSEYGLEISAYLEPGTFENLAEVNIYYGVVDPADGELYFIGEEEGYFDLDDEDGYVSAYYDFSILSISDGEDEIYAYSELWIDGDLMLVDIPLSYVPSNEFDTDDPPHDVTLALAIDEDMLVVSEVYYEVDEYDQWGEVTLDPEGLISPLVQLWDEETQELYWVDSSDELSLWADKENLEYAFSTLDSGLEVWVVLEVLDFGGNSDWVELSVIVP
ncbi:MAG: clostripain-related cysteine peptidase [Actinomycetota bacterium]|nr:clostripain-related cysteine peptidase [Actinomycetota bacterium]